MSQTTVEQPLVSPPGKDRFSHLLGLCTSDEQRERLQHLSGLLQHTNPVCWNTTSSCDQRRVEGLEVQSGTIGECLAIKTRRIGDITMSETPCGLDASAITRRRCNGCPEYRERK